MSRTLAVVSLLALALCGIASASRADPVKLRASWVVVPGELTPIMLATGVARHAGASYLLEETYYKGGPLSISAFAAGDLDIAGFGFVTIATAIRGAGIADLRVIGDVGQDGVEGWYMNHYSVRNDAPIHSIEDLKGRVLAINVKGGLIDVPLRAMLHKHGMDDAKDVTIIEVALPNMKSILLDGKADLIGTLLPFSADQQLQANSRTLFRAYDAVGRDQVSTIVAHADFIAKNRAALVDFLEDYIRAVRWYVDPANHSKAIQIVADFTKQPPSVFDSWAFTRGDQYRNPNAVPDTELLQANVNLLGPLGYLKAPIDMRQYVDGSLAREAAARLSP